MGLLKEIFDDVPAVSLSETYSKKCILENVNESDIVDSEDYSTDSSDSESDLTESSSSESDSDESVKIKTRRKR